MIFSFERIIFNNKNSMYFLSSLLCLLSITYTINAKAANCDDDLGKPIFVSLLYRHGARTPESSFKTDPHKDKFPIGPGQLTNEGKQQHYELGKWLRQRYNSLLTETYRSDLMYVMASDKDRVLMSAECNLAGMFPPKGDQIWNKDLLWQPIPVHTIPWKLDKVVATKHPCPAYDKEFEDVLKSEKVQQEAKKLGIEKIVNVLDKHTGESRKDYANDYKYISGIYDTLLVQSQQKMKLPEWSKEVFPLQLQEGTVMKFTLATWSKKLKRLKSGLLLQEMINNMREKAAGKLKRNVHVYAAHDSTIINLFNTLGVYDSTLPPYAACAMLELRANSKGQHFVTLYYRPSATDQPRLLALPGCDAACPLDQFIHLTRDLIPEDWDKECQLPQ